MTTEFIDLTKVLTKVHEKKWVALTKDSTSVVDFDVDLVALDRRVNKDDVIFMKVPPTDVYFAE